MINSISIVFPFYNEEKRIPKLLKKIEKFNNNNKYNLEYIFVDDGSEDVSLKLIRDFKKKTELNIKIIRYNFNMGKGYALKRGVASASKEWILTTDIDLSVKLEQINIWLSKKKILNNKNIYFGSRLLKDSNIIAKKNRILIGGIFNIFLRLIFDKDFIKIKDTQCGFKLYPNKIAKKIFMNLKENGFIHDVEILILIRLKKYDINELAVAWKHQNGSKINLFIDSFKMLFGLFRLKLKYKV